MPRFHATVDGQFAFTPEEEAEWDAMEAARAIQQAQPAPTKEELMAELAALTAKIQAIA